MCFEFCSCEFVQRDQNWGNRAVERTVLEHAPLVLVCVDARTTWVKSQQVEGRESIGEKTTE